MCGIVGYTGIGQVAPILIEGLEKLEYRGYDSAGISVNANGKLSVSKATGRLSVLSDKINGGRSVEGTSGIGHTRWATHGRPSDENAHPHLSENGRVAIVHNGIIENYAAIREFLENRGRSFASETDTEVAAQLIDYYYQGDLLAAVAQAVRELEGNYALGIMCADDPDRLIAVKSHAPLIVGYSDAGNFFASDVMAFAKYTCDVSYLDDGEIAVVGKDGVEYYSPFLDPIEKPREVIGWDVTAVEKGGHEHFMIKEIIEQPEAIERTIMPYIADGRVDLSAVLTRQEVLGYEKVFIVACGSSYHVGIVTKYNMEKFARIPVEVVLASEFRYCNPLVNEKTLVILISQSGETTDTLEALREAKELGAVTLSIINVEGSSIAKMSDKVIYTKAGPEIAVATTKAYSTQLAVTVMMTLYFAQVRGTISDAVYDEILGGLLSVPEQLRKMLDKKEHIQYLAYQYYSNEDVFFIGRNIDYALSLEGSLKLKEISYIHSDAYPAGELKHGTISLVEDGTLVIAVASYRNLLEKTISNALEVKARGAKVLTFTTESSRQLVGYASDSVITFPDTHEAILPSLAVLPLQLFAYYVALYRGCDIDKPRNLAKSVTVE